MMNVDCPNCGAHLSADLSLTVAGAQPPVQQPPAPQPDPVVQLMLPAEIAGRTRLEVTLPYMPWVSNTFNRKVSPKPLDDTNVFIGHFKTGPDPITAHDLRVVAAEYMGQTTQRKSLLIRNRDGKVLGTQTGTTVTQWMTFTPKVSVGPFAAFTVPDPVLEVNTDYSFVVWNAPGSGASTMLMELYL